MRHWRWHAWWRETVSSGLLRQVRREIVERICGLSTIPMPAIRTVTVVARVASRPSTIARSVVDAASVTSVSICAELHATVAASGFCRHVPRLLHVVVVQHRLIELDAGKQHALVDAGQGGHVIADTHALVGVERGEDVVGAAFKREGELSVRHKFLVLADLTSKAFGDFGVELELGRARFLRVEVHGHFVVEWMSGREDERFLTEGITPVLVFRK